MNILHFCCEVSSFYLGHPRGVILRTFNGSNLKMKYYNLENNIYLSETYILPANSWYMKIMDIDIIEGIEKDIISYKQKVDIMFCGDLNLLEHLQRMIL